MVAHQRRLGGDTMARRWGLIIPEMARAGCVTIAAQPTPTTMRRLIFSGSPTNDGF